MKVLMVNSPVALKFQGGDVTQMHKTAEARRPLGVHVEMSFEPEPDPAGFDLAHVFNLRTVDVTPGQVRRLKRAGLPRESRPRSRTPRAAQAADPGRIHLAEGGGSDVPGLFRVLGHGSAPSG
jgi:hypothetical protein